FIAITGVRLIARLTQELRRPFFVSAGVGALPQAGERARFAAHPARARLLARAPLALADAAVAMHSAVPSTARLGVEEDRLAAVAHRELGDVVLWTNEVVGSEERLDALAQAHAPQIDGDPGDVSLVIAPRDDVPGAERDLDEAAMRARESDRLERREDVPARVAEDAIDLLGAKELRLVDVRRRGKRFSRQVAITGGGAIRAHE